MQLTRLYSTVHKYRLVFVLNITGEQQSAARRVIDGHVQLAFIVVLIIARGNVNDDCSRAILHRLMRTNIGDGFARKRRIYNFDSRRERRGDERARLYIRGVNHCYRRNLPDATLRSRRKFRAFNVKREQTNIIERLNCTLEIQVLLTRYLSFRKIY